jgi:hypothetical protein
LRKAGEAQRVLPALSFGFFRIFRNNAALVDRFFVCFWVYIFSIGKSVAAPENF